MTTLYTILVRYVIFITALFTVHINEKIQNRIYLEAPLHHLQLLFVDKFLHLRNRDLQRMKDQ